MKRYDWIGRKQRRARLARAEQISWDNDVRTGLIHFYTLISVLITFKVVLSGAIFT